MPWTRGVGTGHCSVCTPPQPPRLKVKGYLECREALALHVSGTSLIPPVLFAREAPCRSPPVHAVPSLGPAPASIPAPHPSHRRLLPVSSSGMHKRAPAPEGSARRVCPESSEEALPDAGKHKSPTTAGAIRSLEATSHPRDSSRPCQAHAHGRLGATEDPPPPRLTPASAPQEEQCQR